MRHVNKIFSLGDKVFELYNLQLEQFFNLNDELCI